MPLFIGVFSFVNSEFLEDKGCCTFESPEHSAVPGVWFVLFVFFFLSLHGPLRKI
jgi:hypothetical protein